MSEHDESRRAFLIGTAAGMGAVAGGGLVPATAEAQMHERNGAATAPYAHAPQQVMGDGHGAFLNDDNAATIAALTERLMPGAPGKPGAREAGVLNYIDLALGGAYSDQQDFYRRGLAQLDAYCRATYNSGFVQLDPQRQDEVIGALEAGKATGFTWPTAQAFFNTVRIHTIEGMFADPIYGGNKDFAGWRLVGFPGAQMIYTPADLQSRQAFTREPIMGLQSQAKRPVRRS